MVDTQFQLPEYHSWPFFYTIQKNVDTRERQLKMWSDLILGYCQSQGSYSIGVQELYASALCNNTSINRKLSIESVMQVCEWMHANKFGEWASESKDRIFVYWKSIQEVAAAIHKWADTTGRINSVEVILDLTDDEMNKNEMFYKMPVEIVLRACISLQEVGKAQVFYSDNTDTHGVKFFAI